VEDLNYQVKLIERVKKELGMSQSDIARKFEVGTSTVSKWVKQKVVMPKSVKIALELMIKSKEDEEIINSIKSFSKILIKIMEK
jgi:transcriptional regulator with XRE-family HTH domain